MGFIRGHGSCHPLWFYRLNLKDRKMFHSNSPVIRFSRSYLCPLLFFLLLIFLLSLLFSFVINRGIVSKRWIAWLFQLFHLKLLVQLSEPHRFCEDLDLVTAPHIQTSALHGWVSSPDESQKWTTRTCLIHQINLVCLNHGFKEQLKILGQTLFLP